MQISDKMFTYIDNGELLTQSMLNNYNNSIIVIGDEKQAFIPLLNSYIGGIGKSSYSYIQQMIYDMALHEDGVYTIYSTYSTYSTYSNFLYTPRKINGTYFDGSSDITTTYWGNARNFTIKDYDNTYSGATVSVHGDQNIILNLPQNIHGNLNGTADNADKLDNYHANTLFTEFINESNYKTKISIGGKSISLGIQASLANIANFAPKALISNGTTETINPGEVYGIAGNTTNGSRIPTRWFVNLDTGETELKDGMIISFRMPTAGLDTVGECITIDGDESHFHQIVLNDRDYLTNHFGINTVLTVQYDASCYVNMYGKFDEATSHYITNGNTTTAVYGVWRLLSTYNSNTDVRYQQTIYYPYKTVSNPGAICRYTLCMQTPDGKFTSLTLTNNKQDNSKSMYTGYLDYRKIYYWNSTSVYNAGNSINVNNCLLTHQGDLIDYRYTFNCGSTLTGRSNLYIVGTIDDNGFKLDSTQPWSCSLPTTEDGKVYIYVGWIYPDTNGYRGTLEEVNTPYIYKDGAVRIYNNYAVNATYATNTYISELSYSSYITKEYNENLYAVSFVNINSRQKYYSYNYVSKDTNITVPSGMNINDFLSIHNTTLIRFRGFKSGLYYLSSDTLNNNVNNDGTLFSTYFRGQLLGVASYADALYDKRKINGTYFDGSSDITTTYWGNARNFTIKDYDNTYSGATVSVHGDQNIILNLPQNIHGNLNGTATYSHTSGLANKANCIYNVLKTNDYQYKVIFTKNDSSNVIYSYSYVNNSLIYNPAETTLYSTYFSGWLKGTADSAFRLYKDVKINGTYFTGLTDITTEKWGTARNIIVSDYHSTYTYTNTNIDGGSNITLKLPQNIHANLNGNADTATYSHTSYLSNQTYKTKIISTSSNISYYITFTDRVSYSYTYVNSELRYNAKDEELISTYMNAVKLFRGKVRARDQWGTLGNSNS